MKRAQPGISTATQRPAHQHDRLAGLAAQRHALPSRCSGIGAPCIASSYVPSSTPPAHINRLCSQFAHKLPVSFDEHHGRIEFAFGLAYLHADSSGLHLTALSNNLQDLEKLKHLIATHFERFAWQAELNLDWQ